MNILIDMADFNITTQAGVNLDGVGDALFLHRHRELLQGRDKEVKGTKSATMRFAYPFTFCRRGVIATFDLSAENLHLFATHHWLRHRENVIQLWLDGPAWKAQGGAPTPSMPTPQNRRAEMQAWCCRDLSEHLKRRDLEGPAAVLFANGCRGSDLLAMAEDELVRDVGSSRFAARRVRRARDSLLSGS